MATDKLVERPEIGLIALLLEGGIGQMRREINTKYSFACRQLRRRDKRDGGKEGEDPVVHVYFDGSRSHAVDTEMELDMA